MFRGSLDWAEALKYCFLASGAATVCLAQLRVSYSKPGENTGFLERRTSYSMPAAKRRVPGAK